MSGYTAQQKRPMAVFTAVGLSLCMLFAVTAAFFGCGRLGVYTTTYLDTFDTVLTVTVGAPTREKATEWSSAIHGIAQDLHGQFSAYDAVDGVTNIHAVNTHAGNGVPMPVSEDVLSLLDVGVELYRKTDGRLNICAGALTGLWREAAKAGSHIPDKTAIEAAIRCGDVTALAMDHEAGTAALTEAGVSLDVGAIAKGYALDKMRLYAEEAGITALLINFGGQVMAIGKHPDGTPWTVAIRDPRYPYGGSVLETVEVENAILSTSADDQRAFEVDGVSYHHIIDPETGYPARLYRSVTVILPLEHTAVSDGLSTALFLLSREDGAALLDEYDGSVLWLDGEGRTYTHNWE